MVEQLEAQRAAANAKNAELERQLASSEGRVASGEAVRRSLEARLLIAEESSQPLFEEGNAAAARLAELASSLSEMASKYDDAQHRLDESAAKMARAELRREEERVRQLSEVQKLQAELVVVAVDEVPQAGLAGLGGIDEDTVHGRTGVSSTPGLDTSDAGRGARSSHCPRGKVLGPRCR